MFVTIVILGVIVTAVGMKALGGTSGASGATPLSSGQFAQLNEHACISLRTQLKAVTAEKPRTRAAAARSVHTIASTISGLNMELDGQIPPASEVASFRHFLATIQAAERALNQLDRQTETGQWQRAILLVRSRSWQEMTKRLGLSSKSAHVRCGGARSTDALLSAEAARVSRGTSAASYFLAKPLTFPQFAHRVVSMCISARAQLLQIAAIHPTGLDQAATKIDTLTTSLDSYLLNLRGLTPPPSLTTLVRQALTTLRIEDQAMHNLDELAGTGQWRQAERFVHSRAWHKMLSRLGPPVKPADIRCG